MRRSVSKADDCHQRSVPESIRKQPNYFLLADYSSSSADRADDYARRNDSSVFFSAWFGH